MLRSLVLCKWKKVYTNDPHQSYPARGINPGNNNRIFIMQIENEMRVYLSARKKEKSTKSTYTTTMCVRCSFLLPFTLTASVVCYSINYGIFYFNPSVSFADFLFSSHHSARDTANQIN